MTAGRVGSKTTFYLMRARKGRLLDPSAYQYFAGTPAAPAWSASPGAAKPVFADPNGVDGSELAYDAGLGRYLLTVAHGTDGRDGGELGVFEGPQPWGPWATVDYEDRWLGIPGGFFL